MSLIKLALIVRARRELILSAGEVAKGSNEEPTNEIVEEKVETIEGPAFLKSGLARAGEVYQAGAEIVNLSYPSDSLSLSWYLPAEEAPDSARPVDLTKVGLIPNALTREPPEPGFVWKFRVEARGPIKETFFFDSGFQPPFKSSDLTLHLTELNNFGYQSLVLTQVFYGHRAPSFSEGDWAVPRIVAEGLLED